ncbi:MAG: ABC transporter permease [Acidobacteria bacterium]|nr:ABC transporter permease [Acidobacteriota bacterium]
MLLLEGIRIAIHALVAHKLRSALTLLGTIIAVLSIIAVVSIIQGMNLYVEEKIASLGSNVFSVRRGPFIVLSHEEGEKIAKRRRITMEDAEAIRRLVGSAQYVGASTGTSTLVSRRKLNIESVSIRGRSKFYGLLADFDLDTGRFFSPPEVDRSRPVAVLGWAVADKLFPRIDPMGKKIKIAGTHFQVIGVAEERGNVLGQSRDEFVAIPITIFQKLFGRRRSISIPVKTADLESFDQAREEAILVMRTRHHLKPNQEDDFAVETSESILGFWKTMSAMIFQVSGGVVSLSLVIGGIVIMNIMLVSVTERTREIGIRKALGARRKQILWQFLVESITLSMVGGGVGILFGVGVAQVVAWTTPLPYTVSAWSIAMALAVVFLVGLIFGIYPANRAAGLDPIEALRHE